MISVCLQGKPFNITVIQVYAPTSNAEEAEVERFYEDLQDLLELTPKKDVLFIIGDWNAKVGSQETPGVTGKFGLGAHGLHSNGIARLDGESQDAYQSRVFPDIQKSIDLIQEHLGTVPTFFAYPHGRTDSWADIFLKEHFSMTVTTAFGPVDLSDGCHLLSRHNITTDYAVSHFLK